MENKTHKQPKYTLRKLGLGVVSCLVGFALFGPVTGVVQANEIEDTELAVDYVLETEKLPKEDWEIFGTKTEESKIDTENEFLEESKDELNIGQSTEVNLPIEVENESLKSEINIDVDEFYKKMSESFEINDLDYIDDIVDKIHEEEIRSNIYIQNWMIAKINKLYNTTNQKYQNRADIWDSKNKIDKFNKNMSGLNNSKELNIVFKAALSDFFEYKLTINRLVLKDQLDSESVNESNQKLRK
ncbi:YSIRK-type signal peptide-containing protein [Atopobacter phocae]|uniref:YSIRK-type signal peptide-containing protein n=1 Tax=Atopobacter phocae TaxID=136492 RepID=UPI0004729568|nr:YSIRK-type signal peptide-containing protein [Atopobacter phocae]